MLNFQIALFVSALAFISGCKATNQVPPTNNPPLTVGMRDAFSASSELFGYVWNEKSFKDPSSEKKILSLLDRLTADFHKVEEAAPLTMFEPGFSVTLQTNRAMLADARQRFSAGAKDYANWRLKSLTDNCISCHSRFNAPIDFVGSPPKPENDSFASRLVYAQFLLATRQFENASAELLSLAKTSTQEGLSSNGPFKALKLWLVIQIRVKKSYSTAAVELRELAKEVHFASYEREALLKWIKDLESFVALESSSPEPVQEARELLANIAIDDSSTDQSEDRDLQALVRTLRSSALLHGALQSMPRSDNRRKATYLLAIAYVHTPIDSFEVYKQLYLEQCIREFPLTEEARKAFVIYRDLATDEATGSGGTHLDEEQSRRLKELRNLAFGEEGQAPHETI